MNRQAPVARADFYIPGFDAPFSVFATSKGIVAVSLAGGDTSKIASRTIVEAFPEAAFHLEAAQKALRVYFANREAPNGITIDRSSWTPFQTDIYETLRAIPLGEVVTYGRLALLAGHPGKARAVGMAMGKNPCPILIPCHRVVAAGDTLGGWSGPRGFKERLLGHEGALVFSTET